MTTLTTFTARERPRLLLGGLLAVAAFGTVCLAYSGASLRQSQASPRSGLIDLVQTRQHELDDLAAAVQDLRNELARAQVSARGSTAAERLQAATAARLSLEAGTTAVAGPAVVVHLADSSRKPSDLAQSSAYQIHDTDLQLVVNALFAAGAEAVAVNHNRVVATTPIRAAGQTIVVNFRPLTPPYLVEAIGASRTRFEATDIATRFRRWTDLFGLGFSVRTTRRATLPAYVGKVGITTATPTGDAGGGGAGP